MRVLAGAGTGKTFTMVRKIENLIDEHGFLRIGFSR